jgi:hypothetical protein
MNTGRNDPCPCGSGKKYKHCCLATTQAAVSVEPDVIAAQRKAHEWLDARFGKRMRSQIASEYFEIVLESGNDQNDTPLSSFLDSLSAGENYTLNTGLNDWALHETTYERHGVVARGIEWVLKASDIRLTPPQRAFLQAVLPSYMRIYEVTGVELERGLLLRDLLKPEEPALFVHEISATRGVEPGSIIGARVIGYGDRRELGGSIYPLSPIGSLEILHEFRLLTNDSLDDETTGPDVVDELDPDRALAGLIRDNWLLDRLYLPYQRALPTQSINIIEDEYDVFDVAALESAFDASGTMKALPSRGGWMHLPNEDEPDMTGHFVLHPLDENNESILTRIALHSPNEAGADAGRLWLEHSFGIHVQYRERSHVDVGGDDSFRVPTPAIDAEGIATTTPEQRTAQTQQRYETDYTDWCDTPLTILGARTPRVMLDAAHDRVRVQLLLRVYDEIEESFAQIEKRSPVSFDFLRKELDLLDAG